MQKLYLSLGLHQNPRRITAPKDVLGKDVFLHRHGH